MGKIPILADGIWNSLEGGRPIRELQWARAGRQADQMVFCDQGAPIAIG